MEASKIVNSIGLILDVVGVVLIFKFGLPPNLFKLVNGPTWGDMEPSSEQAAINKKYAKINFVGLCFLIAGFCGQLISNFL